MISLVNRVELSAEVGGKCCEVWNSMRGRVVRLLIRVEQHGWESNVFSEGGVEQRGLEGRGKWNSVDEKVERSGTKWIGQLSVLPV